MARTSTKQQDILEFLRTFTAENGYAPSVREICAAVGLRSTASVHYHLAELKRQGQIDIDENKNRAITLSEAHQPGRIPIIGTVAAGMPILAQENIEGYLPWDGDDTCFALRVQGYSMINAGILDGDHVVVRPQSTADTGDIVVALLDDEATVKRFRRDTHGGIWLLPENPDYQPLDGRYAKILGKVKAVYREY
ncbi:MAG TPA: transcriptional repressor LexA [Candidatus Avoscillospira avistercoris]|uniref:LexA repressor n=1 Tax=Candidatus Avoscillospira avistercoris TaxID=2840707 RepID=A0A9D1FAS4_9FIRM|nr:transcriptional repressor LexA [Candidatus Avoscillospira avistercoris]